jgi:hypothetical protein
MALGMERSQETEFEEVGAWSCGICQRSEEIISGEGTFASDEPALETRHCIGKMEKVGSRGELRLCQKEMAEEVE